MAQVVLVEVQDGFPRQPNRNQYLFALRGFYGTQFGMPPAMGPEKLVLIDDPWPYRKPYREYDSIFFFGRSQAPAIEIIPVEQYQEDILAEEDSRQSRFPHELLNQFRWQAVIPPHQFFIYRWQIPTPDTLEESPYLYRSPQHSMFEYRVWLKKYVWMWDAIFALVNAGLIVKPSVIYQSNPLVPPGYVISQSPPAGTVVNPWTPVQLVVSWGPVNYVEQFPVPFIVGIQQYQANTMLQIAGADVGRVTYANDPFTQAGYVLSQSLTAGTIVPFGTGVDYVVSLGPAIVPPTVIVPVVS